MPKINVKDKRKQQLVEANMACIAKHGFTGTTIAHVSQAAGMSRGIVNFYFTTKESMMLDTLKFLVEEYSQAWQQALEAKANVSAREKLDAIVEAHFHSRICNQKRLSIWAAYIGHASTHPDYRKLITAGDQLHFEAVSALYREALSNGTSAQAAGHFASELHAMTRGLWLTYLLSPQVNDRKVLVDICKAFIDRECAPKAAYVAVVEQAPKAAKKPKAPAAAKPASQMDFGDLFSAKK